MANRTRKTFGIGAPGWRYPQGALPAAKSGPNKSISGGRVGGRAKSAQSGRGKELLTEAERIRQHRDKMKRKNPRVFQEPMSPRGVPWNHTNTYNDLADRVDPDQTYTTKNVTIGFVSAPSNETTKAPHTYHEETKKAKAKTSHTAYGSQPMLVHRKHITTGRPTTRAIWNVVKQNGLSRQVLYDTKYAAASNVYDITPLQKDATSGFNQRLFTVLSPSAYVNGYDLIQTIGNETASTVQTAKSQRAYASILDATTELQLHNQASHYSATIKIHLVKALERGELGLQTIQDAIEDQVLNDNLTVAKACALPLWMQFSDPIVEQSADEAKAARSKTVGWLQSIKGKGPMESSYFRDNFEIVKTTSIKLPPGDVLNYRHTHCFGPGIDVGTLCDADATAWRLNEPASYFYIVEQYGFDTAELTFTYETNKQTSYLGRPNTHICMEARKSIRYANPESIGDAFDITGVQSLPVHMRVWDSDSNITAASTEREFNLAPNLITGLNPPPTGQGTIFTRSALSTAVLTNTSRPNT